MPWKRDQAIAVMLKAQRSGDRKLAKKAKGYLKSDTPVVKAQRRKKR